MLKKGKTVRVRAALAGSKVKDLKPRKHMIHNLGWRTSVWEKEGADRKSQNLICDLTASFKLRILRRFSLLSIFLCRYIRKEKSERWDLKWSLYKLYVKRNMNHRW